MDCVGADPKAASHPRAGQLRLLAELAGVTCSVAGHYLSEHPDGCRCPDCAADPVTNVRLAYLDEEITDCWQRVLPALDGLVGSADLGRGYNYHEANFGRLLRDIADYADRVYAASGVEAPLPLEDGPGAVELCAGHRGRAEADLLVICAVAGVLVRLADRFDDAHGDEGCGCPWCREGEAVGPVLADLAGMRWAVRNAADAIAGSVRGAVTQGKHVGVATCLENIAREVERLEEGWLPVLAAEAPDADDDPDEPTLLRDDDSDGTTAAADDDEGDAGATNGRPAVIERRT